jgi:hypothetical protein
MLIEIFPATSEWPPLFLLVDLSTFCRPVERRPLHKGGLSPYSMNAYFLYVYLFCLLHSPFCSSRNKCPSPVKMRHEWQRKRAATLTLRQILKLVRYRRSSIHIPYCDWLGREKQLGGGTGRILRWCFSFICEIQSRYCSFYLLSQTLSSFA